MEDFSTEHRRTLREEIHKPNAYRPRIQTFDDRKLLDTFIKMLPNGGKVLDYGCSEGVIAEYFFQKGLQLTCTDIAQSALDMTKQKITSPLLETLQTNSPHDLGERHFDGIFCGGVLHHIPPAEWSDYVHTFHSMLNSHGVLLLTGHSNKTEDFATGTRISPFTGLISHSIDDIEPLLTREGFTIKESGYIEGKEPKSPMKRYLKYVIVEK